MDPLTKKGFKIDLEAATKQNSNFRQVLYTSNHSQLVLMSLAPGEDIGMEIHPGNDQFFRFESGQGQVVINGNVYEVTDGDCVVVPAGARHNVINNSTDQYLKLYTIYSPAHHQDGVVRLNKDLAEQDSPEFDGVKTED